MQNNQVFVSYKYLSFTNVMQQKVIVIGSGVAGLASAIRLACRGYAVTIFEKNHYTGGKLSAFKFEDYSFDAGPSLFTQAEYLEELFLLAKEPIQEYFEYQKIDESCRYFFADGSEIIAPVEAAKFAKVLKEHFGEEETKVIEYLKRSATAFDNIGTLFTERSLHQKESYGQGRLIKALKATKISYLTKSLNSYNESFFKHPNTIQLFNRFATYNGSNPYKAPAMLSMIPHFEMNIGAYYPFGGMISITNALTKLARKKGVQIITNAAVQEIGTTQGKVSGVRVNNEFYEANRVVSNMDIYFTYRDLLNNQTAAKKILRQERSSSAFIFYWAIDTSFSKLGLHNIFFTKDYKAEFEYLFNKGQLINDPTIYINITSKLDQGQAPIGCENWFVMLNAPANKGQDWAELKNEFRKNILNKLQQQLGIDVAKHIVFEDVLTPLQIESKTSSYMGSLYGSSSNSKMAAFMRQNNKSKDIEGLYFVGGSVHPGGGIPLCLGSAKIVANLIPDHLNV
jgi:phytoene desaturase